MTTGNDPLAGAEHPNSLGRGGEDFYALREYVVGDDLRRVHWPSTARHDDLMVRQDELPWQGRATVLVDVRASTNTAESLELVISAAASIVASSARRQDLVRLVVDRRRRLGLRRRARPHRGDHGAPGQRRGHQRGRLPACPRPPGPRRAGRCPGRGGGPGRARPSSSASPGCGPGSARSRSCSSTAPRGIRARRRPEAPTGPACCRSPARPRSPPPGTERPARRVGHRPGGERPARPRSPRRRRARRAPIATASTTGTSGRGSPDDRRRHHPGPVGRPRRADP